VASLFDHDRFLSCLFELESALSRIGIRECQDLHANTQLSAAIYALLRATSLFRSLLLLLRAGLMDASDVIRRAYWEAWMLGYEFRIKSASTHATRWHLEKNKHGEPNIGLVKSFENSHGITTSAYGAAYGGLSEVSHPTKSAAENSVVTINSVHGDTSGRVDQAREIIAQGDAPPMMYLLVWTIFAEWPGMLSLGITPKDIPESAAYYNEYNRRNSGAITQ